MMSHTRAKLPDTGWRSDDNYVRVFDAAGRSDPFKLRHDWSVASVAWMDGTAGLLSIGINGVITKWTPLMESVLTLAMSSPLTLTPESEPHPLDFGESS
jgi:hypothetical protein